MENVSHWNLFDNFAKKIILAKTKQFHPNFDPLLEH